ncbi:MAG: hypothetical protein JOZ41_06340 [Chloroflexi bacterium]|nr:hypothetical protein [Chloroflexota bacterium]
MIDVLGIDNILFGVGDLEEARAFYEGKLGLPVARLPSRWHRRLPPGE